MDAALLELRRIQVACSLHGGSRPLAGEGKYHHQARAGKEAAEIRYIHITKNSQGMEEIEVQGKFLLSWIGKRILTTQIITEGHDTEHSIRHCEADLHERRSGAQISRISAYPRPTQTPEAGKIDYTSEQYVNAQLAAETAAKAAKLGIRVTTNARTGKHTFSVYKGRDLTAGNAAGNALVSFHRNSTTSWNRNTRTALKTLKQRLTSAERKKKALRGRLPKSAEARRGFPATKFHQCNGHRAGIRKRERADRNAYNGAVFSASFRARR